MAASTPPIVPCPTCAKPVTWNASSPWRPFCSERCKLIDLGEWMSEAHRIAGEPVDPESIAPDPASPTKPENA